MPQVIEKSRASALSQELGARAELRELLPDLFLRTPAAQKMEAELVRGEIQGILMLPRGPHFGQFLP